METILLISILAFIAGFWVAMRDSSEDEGDVKPPENYEKMIEQMNDYRTRVGVKPIKRIDRE